ncbi:hypothetical protein [Nocardia sp. NPDC051570]
MADLLPLLGRQLGRAEEFHGLRGEFVRGTNDRQSSATEDDFH